MERSEDLLGTLCEALTVSPVSNNKRIIKTLVESNQMVEKAPGLEVDHLKSKAIHGTVLRCCCLIPLVKEC
jgi:MOSC domain-containing protein YiiM